MQLGQYIILLFIKRKINLHKIPQAKYNPQDCLDNSVFFDIGVYHHYLTNDFCLILQSFSFELSLCTSYGLSVVLLGFLAKRFFSWFRSSHDIIIALYAIAMGLLSINAVFTILTVMIGLTDQQEEIRLIDRPEVLLLM